MMLIAIVSQRNRSESDVQLLIPRPGRHSNVKLDGGGLRLVHVRVGLLLHRFNMDCRKEITAILMFGVKFRKENK